MKRDNIKNFVFLHCVLLLYSLTSVISKVASRQNGIKFFMLYGCALIALAGYAVLWQFVLKKFSLTFAFLNKSIVVVWGIIWGRLFFNEIVTINKIIGALIIIMGIMIVVKDSNE